MYWERRGMRTKGVVDCGTIDSRSNICGRPNPTLLRVIAAKPVHEFRELLSQTSLALGIR
jgi:hypothetical protein